MNYEVGKTFLAMLSDGLHTFTVLDEKLSLLDTDFIHIVWDDGDEESVYIKDADRWVEEANEIEDINRHTSIFDLVDKYNNDRIPSVLKNGRFNGFVKEEVK